jgi:hypothetical protein
MQFLIHVEFLVVVFSPGKSIPPNYTRNPPSVEDKVAAGLFEAVQIIKPHWRKTVKINSIIYPREENQYKRFCFSLTIPSRSTDRDPLAQTSGVSFTLHRAKLLPGGQTYLDLP